ncbi:MAG: hypothetical protein ACI9F9_001377 [Candidatus Paceibacteria bacterium]|jgi:hypothetical protein
MEPMNSSQERAWGWHALLAAWITVVIVLGGAASHEEHELWESWETGDSETQLEVLNALSQRGSPEKLGGEFLEALLTSSSPKIRELAFTNLFTRHAQTRVKMSTLKRISDPQERRRASLWLDRQMTTPNRISLKDLDRWFEADLVD